MRIALIQRFLPSRSRGGVGYFTHGLAHALSKRGHEVTVFSQDPAPEDAAYQVRRISSGGISEKWLPLAFPFQIACQDFSGFDILNAQGDDQWISGRQAPPRVRTLHGAALLEAYFNGIRNCSLKHFLLHSYFYACEWIADLKADRVVAVSKDTKRYYPRVHEIIGNGIDLALFKPPLFSEKTSYPSILFVGELGTRKRGSLLVKTFEKWLRPSFPSCELWLVSPEKIEGPGLRCFENLSTPELVKLYQKVWVFCLPSSYEGFGRPYVEAMACGTPVVASPNPGAREILENGLYGLLAEDRSLGEVLLELLRDADRRQEMSRRGLERAKNYGWDVIALQYERLYEDLLKMSFKKGKSSQLV